MNVGDTVTPQGRLVMTAEDMAEDREGWLRLRRGHDDIPGFYCIGSSDTAGILGISFGREDSQLRGTPVKTWLQKTRGLDTPDNGPMMWGRLHEDTVASYWRSRNRTVTERVGLVGSMIEPWHQTSLDRICTECPLDRKLRGRCAVEIKTRGAFGSHRWHADLPDDILAQVCHQIFVSGFDHIHWAVLIGGNDYRQGVVYRDREQDTISYVIDACNAFRDAYLRPGAEVEPEWDVDMAAQALIDLDALKYPDRQGLAYLDDIGPVQLLALARANSAYWRKQEATAKAAVLRQSPGARTAVFNDHAAYEFTPTHRTHIDQERLAEKYPQVWDDPEVREDRQSWTLKIDKELAVKLTKPTTPEEEEV